MYNVKFDISKGDILKRSIITINEEECNNCGICTKICVSQALQIIGGKMKLASEKYCDGFGSCIGVCPQKALNLELKEAEEYSEALVMENISSLGEKAILGHLNNLKRLNQKAYIDEALLYLEEKCLLNNDFKMEENPDYRKEETMKNLIRNSLNVKRETSSKWPTRLDLLFSNSNILDGADLVIAADCAPFVFKNFKKKFLSENQVLITFCPKSENTMGTYVGKLAYIFEQKNVNSITVVRLESECCKMTEETVLNALRFVNMDLKIKTYSLSLDGEMV